MSGNPTRVNEAEEKARKYLSQFMGQRSSEGPRPTVVTNIGGFAGEIAALFELRKAQREAGPSATSQRRPSIIPGKLAEQTTLDEDTAVVKKEVEQQLAQTMGVAVTDRAVEAAMAKIDEMGADANPEEVARKLPDIFKKLGTEKWKDTDQLKEMDDFLTDRKKGEATSPVVSTRGFLGFLRKKTTSSSSSESKGESPSKEPGFEINEKGDSFEISRTPSDETSPKIKRG